ncbi:MAG: cobalamin-dependent protein [Deltaproteobacteria bacterium]|nr:cobalamin-dependent protein [Deltaproteobacteria bacterium]
MAEPLVRALVEMQEPQALEEARRLLDGGSDPLRILEACSVAMETVGKHFENGQYFLPHLMLAGEMLRQISEMVKPFIAKDKPQAARGRVMIGTVEGDIHDIGKNMVVFLLEANGFQVLDIGVDQSPQKFVDAIRDFRPEVVGMSGLLTLAFDSMKKTVRAIEEAGLRDRVRIMIGGGLVTEKVKGYTGADAYAADAVAGVRLAKEWTGGGSAS